jgi:hypothetical protein
MEPVAETLSLPPSYGTPSVLLEWTVVEARLRDAAHYWLASVRPDGRPHTVPVDGLWRGDHLVFGGDPATVHHRNLLAITDVTVHLPDADAATIVEGVAERHTPVAIEAHDLARASREKYGYSPPASAFREGVWLVRPRVVLAWTALYRDATRYCFA